MMTKKTLPTNATIAVTYKCNARCIMCNIWKEESKDLLTLEDFAKLPKTLKDINITGGEPFLRKDIIDICRVLTDLNPKTRLIFSSNGLLTDKIVNSMQEIKKFNSNVGIGISIDGIDNVHSEVRGIPDAYEKALKTVKKLKEADINDIRLAFTASDKNVQDLSKVYNLAQEMGVEFTMSIVHNSDNYFNIDTNLHADYDNLEKEVNYVLQKEFKYNNPRRLMRLYYLKGILEFAKTGKRPLKCYALDNAFFMDSNGEIFPCNIEEISIGNITNQNFEEIWNAEKAQKLRKTCGNCNKCWMVCTVKNSIMKHPVQVAGQVLMDKLKSCIIQ